MKNIYDVFVRSWMLPYGKIIN